MEVAELAPGLWRWTAQGAGCFYVESGDTTLLVDPLLPPGEEERFWRALDRDVERRARPVAVVLTGGGHAHDGAAIRKRYGARVLDGEPGVRALDGGALWLASHCALAAGAAIESVDGELRVVRAPLLPSVRAWLELPVEHVLVRHGEQVPGGRAALAAALGRAPLSG